MIYACNEFIFTKRAAFAPMQHMQLVKYHTYIRKTLMKGKFGKFNETGSNCQYKTIFYYLL